MVVIWKRRSRVVLTILIGYLDPWWTSVWGGNRRHLLNGYVMNSKINMFAGYDSAMVVRV